MKKTIEKILIHEFPGLTESKYKLVTGDILRLASCDVPVTYNKEFDHIRNVICSVLVVSIGAFHANTRIGNVKYARHMFCYIAKDRFQEQTTLDGIARYIGGVDFYRHPNVNNCIKKCKNLLSRDKEFISLYNEIAEKLNIQKNG